jgi:putative ABC transport system permease protein
MERLLQDLRTTARGLRRTPGFTIIVVLTIALGIGANTAIFSVVNAALFRPPPYPDSDQLVYVWNQYTGLGLDQASSSPPDYLDRRDQNRVFSDIAAFWQRPATLTGTGEPERLQAAHATASLFSVLRVAPEVGRIFSPEEDQPGMSAVAVLSHDTWQRRFGGDDGVAGRVIVLDGTPVTVVGVMPKEYDVPAGVDLWMPAAFTPEQLSDAARGNEWLSMVARLRPGVSVEAAQADMQRIAGTLQERFPEFRDYIIQSGMGAKVVGMRESGTAPVRSSLLLLLGAVGLVLLIASANVANLLLVRATRRRKEIAIRATLGAGWGRIVRQLLTESLVLALAGGIVGLLLGYWMAAALLRLHPQGILGVYTVSMDARVLGYAIGISLLTGVLFGLAPAYGARMGQLATTLRSGGKTSDAGAAGGTMRRALVVAEVALTLVLLVGAGLMLRSFSKLLQVDPGFRTSEVLTFSTSLPAADYPQSGQVVAFYESLDERLRGLPGVEGVAFTSRVPLGAGGATRSVQPEGRLAAAGQPEMLASYTAVSGEYFRTMGIPLVAGRSFERGDQPTTASVIMVDEGLARRLWVGESPLGKRLQIGGEDGQWSTVVGVVGDVRSETLGESGSHGMLYRPFTQDVSRDLAAVVHTAADEARLVPMIREAVGTIDANLPVFRVAPIEQVVAASIAAPRLRMRLLGVFAVIALLLAAVGIYGVVAYSVAQRTQEIGVRMALGAQPSGVVRMVVGNSLRTVVIGIAVGSAAAFMGTRLVQSLLYGVSAADPLTFTGVALLLLGVALLASLLPARRATRVAPTVALRAD